MRVVCLMLTRNAFLPPFSRCNHLRGRSKITVPFQVSPLFILLLLLLQESVIRVLSLPPPTPPCCCSPTAYSFQLDFSRTCPPADVVEGSDTGIERVFCQIDFPPSPGAGEGTLIPEVVTKVQIFELDLDLTVVRQVELSELSLGDGDTFEFTSVGCGAAEDDILGGLQMRVTGENDLGEVVVNDWIVDYTNLCDTEVFFPSNSLGWVVFGQLSPPQSELCFSGTEKPTGDPTEAPAPPGDRTESPTDGSMSYPMKDPYF